MKIGLVWLVGLGNVFSGYRYKVYLHGVPGRMSNLRRLACVGSSGESVNEQTSQSTRRTLGTITQSLMVHAQVLEASINFILMYTADNIFPVLPIKDLIDEDSEPTTSLKLEMGTKNSILHLHVLFFPCVLQKPTAHVGIKALNMRHQAQNRFCGIFVGITRHKKGCLVYVPN